MNRMALLLMAALSGLPTIDSEAKAAHANVERFVAPPDRPYVRYLTLQSIPNDGHRKAARAVARGWVNQLSVRRRIAYPTEETGTLIRVDLRDYGWTADDWEALVANDPYVNYSTVEPATLNALNYYTGASRAIARFDRFAAKTCVEPLYSKFLDLPATLVELQAKFGVQKEAVKTLSLIQRAAIPAGYSEVAHHNRLIDRYPSITGYYYQTFDTKTNVADQNVLDNPLGIRFDGGEVIWSLPNGLQGYWLLNAEGKQVAEVPPDIARDSQTPYSNKSVVNARSCVGCHKEGLKDLADVISKRVRERKVALDAYDKAKTIELEELFLSRLKESLERDRQQYADALHAACQMKPADFAKQFVALVYEYDDVPINAKRAAIELGVEESDLPKVLNAAALAYPQVSGILTSPIDGTPIGRDSWEQVFAFAAIAAKQFQKGGK